MNKRRECKPTDQLSGDGQKYCGGGDVAGERGERRSNQDEDEHNHNWRQTTEYAERTANHLGQPRSLQDYQYHNVNGHGYHSRDRKKSQTF